jgi:very-short-patch-repair endonuclease
MDNNNKPTYSNSKRIDILEKDGWGARLLQIHHSTAYSSCMQENRKNMTESESILWHYIRRDALGVTFLRQFIIGEYIVDFACLIPKFLIEVDGGYHSEPRQQQNDQVRQQ